MIRKLHGLWLCAFLVLCLSAWVHADEGMWTFDNIPKSTLKKKYGFDASARWLEHLQKSSVRFNNGGSGSFVSASGLVMTNHHVAADCLQKLGSQGIDYYKNGFYATSPDLEARCVDLELNVLMGIADVTSRVNQVVSPGMDAGKVFAAQQGVMSTIEKECSQNSGLRCDVVTLYQGGVYSLYKYKKYTDVRLVFAPEMDIAFFGGDPDNFTYPRFDLDVTFFRVYENNQPVHLEHYLHWSRKGAKPGELALVSGHPGTTNRLNTLAQLEYLRDKAYPFTLNLLKRRQSLLQEFSRQSEENARIAKEELFGIENSLKAYTGFSQGLMDPAVMKKKAESERGLLEKVSAKPEWQKAYGSAWEAIAQAQVELTQFYKERSLFDHESALNSELFSIARTLVRLAAEKSKPNEKRLREFGEANLPSLELELYSPAPLYDSFEKLKLTDSLQFMVEQIGGEHPVAKKILGGKTPGERAEELVSNTKLKDAAFRKQLAEGGSQAVNQSTDSMIVLAREIDAEARTLRARYEDKVQGVERVNHALLAKALFQISGTSIYPDATFTLRLSFGPVQGYEEDGKTIPPFTQFDGLYRRSADHGNTFPYRLPESWNQAKMKLTLSTPFNFVLTADIIGGNSGSPVVNGKGEVVGLIFDGNLQSLVWNFLYDDRQGRAVAVHSAGLIEALDKVYGADRVVQELRK
jgi:hypothetical protein